jgi:fido (protein-threonine AMPylation protein)
MGLNLNYEKGQTPLNDDEKEGLKIKSITTQNELNEFEQLNIEKAVEWSMQVNLKPENIFTESFIKELHKKMYDDVWKWAGKFRKTDKNLGVKCSQISI